MQEPLTNTRSADCEYFIKQSEPQSFKVKVMGITLVLFAGFELVYTHLNWGKGDTAQFANSPVATTYLSVVSTIFAVWLVQGLLQTYLGFSTSAKVQRGKRSEVETAVSLLKWFSIAVIVFALISVLMQTLVAFEMAETAKKYVTDHGVEHLEGWQTWFVTEENIGQAAEATRIAFLVITLTALGIQFLFCAWCFGSTWKYSADVAYVASSLEPVEAPEFDTEKGNALN